MAQGSLLLSDIARDLVVPALVFGVLAVAVKRRAIAAAIVRCRTETVTNLLLFFVNAVAGVLLLTPAVQPLLDAIDTSRALAPLWARVPEPLILLIAIALIDFAAYWRHRFEHHAALWRIHATHHADTALHWLSVHRKHPLAKLFSLVLDTAVVLALGVPAWAIVGAALLRTWWGYFIHADVPWTLGPLGRWLISPAAHRLHHIRDERLMGTNYGNTITLWDRMFGTYCDPAPYLDCEVGIAEGTRGFFGELARPFEARYRRAAAAAETPSDARPA